MARRLTLLAMAGAGLVAGCGQDGGSEPASPVAAASSWNATDACAILDKAKVAEIVGAAVTEAALAGVSPAEGGRAALSTCTYQIADGSAVGLLTRAAEDGEGVDAAIAEASTGGGVLAKPDPVAGLGRAAFWTPGLNSLQVFLDERRYVAVNLSNPKAGSDPKAIVQKLAEAVR